jgi:CRP/FNR family transcriptional regulator, cyclic AMP receptor protein
VFSRGSDHRVDAALAQSFLATLPAATCERLVAGATQFDIPAGAVLYRDEDSPRFGVVVGGLVRIFLTSAGGRQITVRYARSGAIIGAPTAIGGPVDVSAQALTETTLLMLNVDAVRSFAKADPGVAWLLAEEVTRRLYEVLLAFSGNAFGSVRQRVARHLIDLAADRQQGALLIAPVSQQALADAVGTAREVVARTLHDLRRAGLVDTAKKGIVLVDPDGLSEVAATGRL